MRRGRLQAKNKFLKFITMAKKLGASDAKIIKAATIRTGAWVKMKCRYGCDGYNTNNCCPPHTPTHTQTQEVIDCYKIALLVHNKRVSSTTGIIVRLEREIFLSGYYKALGLGAGPCQLCAECSIGECKHSYQARPSMEACGIDVFATARANGFPIVVVKNRGCEGNYYGLVMIE